jgi:hypothetical protein
MADPKENLGGDYARDTHRGGLGDDYAREGEWSGAGRADDIVRGSHDHTKEEDEIDPSAVPSKP